MTAASDPRDASSDSRIAHESQRLAEFLRATSATGPLLLLTGAGVSTASGIGDYRDNDGQYKRPPPVTIAQFLANHQSRQRYWARSLFGWPAFSAAQPNAAHSALAQLQTQGYADHLVTQNVDGLHQRAGHERVLELHGNLHGVECVRCGTRTTREQLQAWLSANNAHLLGHQPGLAPDGDADLRIEDFSNVAVPDCRKCGGIVKPTVVFFGDSVPRDDVERAYDWVAQASGLLIVGSSVMIHSSFRFARRAHELGRPLVALNVGRTRADDWLTHKLTAPCELLLPALLTQLSGTFGDSGHPTK
ncbi:MAG: NAD-dependent protein deacetylase [Pseudomonadales bacterium]